MVDDLCIFCKEMDVPITADEIIQTSKNLKEPAPGLDGMKKRDMNKNSSRRHGHPCDTLAVQWVSPRCAQKRNCYSEQESGKQTPCLYF